MIFSKDMTMNTKIYRLAENDLHDLVSEAVRLVLEGFQRDSGVFNVKGMLRNPVSRDYMANSTGHMSNDRSGRVELYREKVRSVGDPAYSFVVNTGHPNGDEVHTITEKAFIVIQNKESGRIVTILAARPNQVKRYWEGLGMKTPSDGDFALIMRFASNNRARGLHHM